MSHPVQQPAQAAPAPAAPATPSPAQQRQADADYGLFGTLGQPQSVTTTAPATVQPVVPAAQPGFQPTPQPYQPAVPAPTQPQQQQTPAAPAAPANTAVPQFIGPDGQPWDPQRAMQTIQHQRTRERELEQSLQTHQQMLQQVQQLLGGGAPNTPPDPAALAAQVQQEQAARREAQVQLAVWQNAHAAGADPARVLGWMPFHTAIKGLDPTAPDFAAQLGQKLAAEVAANPWLRAETPAVPPVPPAVPPAADPAAAAQQQPVQVQPQIPAVSGGQVQGGGAPTPITEAQLKAMTPEQIEEAWKAGRLAHLA
jgi:hypothetical protein